MISSSLSIKYSDTENVQIKERWGCNVIYEKLKLNKQKAKAQGQGRTDGSGSVRKAKTYIIKQGLADASESVFQVETSSSWEEYEHSSIVNSNK